MAGRLIIEGNTVYEIDEECLKQGEKRPVKRARDNSAMKKQDGERKPQPER